MNYKLIDLKTFGDDRGHLVSFEKGTNCPFEVKRTFYIFDTKPGIARGAHANRNSEFLLIAMNGSCKVKINDGNSQEVVILDTPHKALYLDKMLWKEMYDFSYNAVLLVLANTNYDEKEYIRSYEEFLEEIPNEDILLVKYDDTFLEESFYWLNDNEIKYLTDTPDFTKESQKTWYNALNDKANYKIWGLSFNNIDIGACGLKNITNTSAEYFGYIGEKKYWGKGIGSRMLLLIIKEAKKLSLKELTLKVIPENKKAIKLYEKFNFNLIERNEANLLYKKILS